MNRLIALIVEKLPEFPSENRKQVLRILENLMDNPTQELINALYSSARQADDLLTERWMNS